MSLPARFVKAAAIVGLLMSAGCATIEEKTGMDQFMAGTTTHECDDPELTREYEKLYTTMVVTKFQDNIDQSVDKIIANRARYVAVEQKTGVSRYIIAAIHSMEASLSFDGNMYNGEPLDQVTEKRPAGKGPWDSWEASAIDAMTDLKNGHLKKHLQHDTSASMACVLEAYNGFGYRNQHILSPYLWSGTNHYKIGKYVEKKEFLFFGPYKSIFYPFVISDQPGAMPLIKALKEKGF